MTIVGYYDTSIGSRGSDSYGAPATAVGQTAVGLDSLTMSSLADVDTLFLLNPSNDGYGAEFLQSQRAIEAFVRAGGHVVIFDGYVTTAGSILPGQHDLEFTRDPGTKVDFEDDHSFFIDGPGGRLDDSSLDGGNSSDHGYIDRSQMNANWTVIQTTGDPEQVVSFSYGLGAGSVFYSSIPVDYYLTNSGAAGFPAFVENVLAAVAIVKQSGSAGADFFHVAGDDQAVPGGFNDLTLATDARDDILAGRGDDVVFGGAGDDRLDGGAGMDVIHGEAGRDVILGGSGSDRLGGGGGVDVLFGDDGADVLRGGGRDALYGGADADTFLLAAAYHGKIQDFSSLDGDRIDLHRIDANAITDGNQAFAFVGTAAFSQTAGELRFEDGLIQGDLDGDGQADVAFRVTDVTAVDGADFIL